MSMCECERIIPDSEHHCAIHHADEYSKLIAPGYTMCRECFHIYKSDKELVAAFNETNKEMGLEKEPLTDASKIFFCPHCLHDF